LIDFHRWESVRVFVNGIGKLDFLHLSKFFKQLSISSIFTVTLCIAIVVVQLFHELNLQLDCSIEAIQKAVFSHLTACVIVCDFYIYYYFFHLSPFTFVVLY